MVGFEISRFLRKAVPSESQCFLCQNVMNGPIQCTKCKIWVCISCSSNSSHLKCKHEYTEINKFMKNKIDEMIIKCKYWSNGCNKTLKVKEIEKHEENCEFSKNECKHPECHEKNLKTKELIHSENCPYSNYICDKGCGKEMKLLERENHDCVGWLLKVIEMLKIRNTVINEESKDIKNEFEEMNSKYNCKTNQFNQEINTLSQKNNEIKNENLKINEDIKNLAIKSEEKYRNIVKQTIEEIDDKFVMNSIKANKELELYSRRINDQFSSFLQKNSQNLYDFNAKVQADSFQIAGVPTDMKQLDQNPLKNVMMVSPNKANNSKILANQSNIINKTQISPVPEKK